MVPPISKLDGRSIGRPRKRDLLTGDEGGGGGPKSYESEKACSSIIIQYAMKKACYHRKVRSLEAVNKANVVFNKMFSSFRQSEFVNF